MELEKNTHFIIKNELEAKVPECLETDHGEEDLVGLDDDSNDTPDGKEKIKNSRNCNLKANSLNKKNDLRKHIHQNHRTRRKYCKRTFLCKECCKSSRKMQKHILDDHGETCFNITKHKSDKCDSTTKRKLYVCTNLRSNVEEENQ